MKWRFPETQIWRVCQFRHSRIRPLTWRPWPLRSKGEFSVDDPGRPEQRPVPRSPAWRESSKALDSPSIYDDSHLDWHRPHRPFHHRQDHDVRRQGFPVDPADRWHRRSGIREPQR